MPRAQLLDAAQHETACFPQCTDDTQPSKERLCRSELAYRSQSEDGSQPIARTQVLNSQICKHDFELSHRQFCESMPAEAQMLHAGSRSELEPIASFHQPRELLEPPRSVLKDSSVEGYIARPES
jgi:hypothetical protein